MCTRLLSKFKQIAHTRIASGQRTEKNQVLTHSKEFYSCSIILSTTCRDFHAFPQLKLLSHFSLPTNTRGLSLRLCKNQVFQKGKLTVYCHVILIFTRVMLCSRGLCCRAVSVCPSVRLSHASSVSKGLNFSKIKNLLDGLVIPFILVISLLASAPNSKGNPFRGGFNTRGGKNLRFSTEIAIFLGNGTR